MFTSSRNSALSFCLVLVVCFTVTSIIWVLSALHNVNSEYENHANHVTPQTMEEFSKHFTGTMSGSSENWSAYDLHRNLLDPNTFPKSLQILKNLKDEVVAEIKFIREEGHDLRSRIFRGKGQQGSPESETNIQMSGKLHDATAQNMKNARKDHDEDNYQSMLSKMREIELKLQEMTVQDKFSPSNRLDCFHNTTCILIKHTSYGRSGNRYVQLRNVVSMLSRCSGAAISFKDMTDAVVHFPPMQIYGKPSCFPIWDRLTDVEYIFNQLRTLCQVFDFAWNGQYEGMNCSLQSPAKFHRIDLNSRFPAWLEISLEAWQVPLSNSTALLHFRGGDIFRVLPHSGYTQPVCDHYIQAFRHSGAACAVLVAEDDKNPCVAAVEASLNCTHRPSKCSPACAFTYIARARLIIASKSTFLTSAMEIFPGTERQVYYSYCSDCPLRTGSRTTKFCSDTNRTELFPWNASERQLTLLLNRTAHVVVC
jgi:hypothetical protein